MYYFSFIRLVKNHSVNDCKYCSPWNNKKCVFYVCCWVQQVQIVFSWCGLLWYERVVVLARARAPRRASSQVCGHAARPLGLRKGGGGRRIK